MTSIIDFFDHPFFTILGGIASIISILTMLAIFIAWIFGIAPIAWKLGISRWSRKIGIASSDDIWHQLEADLINSGIFRKRNIERISATNISTVRNYSLILVHYKSFNEGQLREIFRTKRSESGMIVYYPEFHSEEGDSITPEMIRQIHDRENSSVVNFRGRLLSDLVLTFITTSFANHG